MASRMLLSLMAFLAALSARAAEAPARPTSIAPLTIENSGGNPRVIVVAEINGHRMPMMVHSNAGFFAQLKHAQAASFGVHLIAGTHKSYGIDRPGHVSSLGLDRGVATTLSVSGSVNEDAPVSIFEVPQAHLGMLGLGWITANHVIVDFPRRRVWVSPSRAQTSALADALHRQGYTALPMAYDDQGKTYAVSATINGVTRSMVVSTASSFLIDSAFASAANIPLGREQGEGGGPTGASVPTYALAKPVRVTIGTWTSPLIHDGMIQDEYGYLGRKPPLDPADADGGTLGGEFLQRTAAIVDFGTRTLFVKRTGGRKS